jgi:IS5 family transposase
MLGKTDPQLELLDADQVCGHLVPAGSLHRSLAEIGDRLFSDADFADMYDPSRGRHSVPPSLLAKVVLLQSLEGISDRETLGRVRRDLGWKVALRLPLQYEGFDPTVLVYFRMRLRRSERPRRIFERFKEIAGEAGLLPKKATRVLDSTPVLSAVQTEDTVSLIRGALRRLLGLLAQKDGTMKAAVESALRRQDYDRVGKPVIDWDDEAARTALVDELVNDALAALGVLENRPLSTEVAEAVELLATVAGQDVEQDERTGGFRLRQGVARGRVISTVDPEARHGRKTRRAPFDGYKAHVAVEPKSELITEIDVAPANVSDGSVAPNLLPELAAEDAEITVVGDSAYGSGASRTALLEAGAVVVAKAPPVQNSSGGFPKSAFTIDLQRGTVVCPAGVTTTRVVKRPGRARFQFPAHVCAACPLREACTSSPRGRSVNIGPYEELLVEARIAQRTEAFKAVYNATRPTVERVLSRLVRRGGRKARYRGRLKVREQLTMKASAENLKRMFSMGLKWTDPEGWAVA